MTESQVVQMQWFTELVADVDTALKELSNQREAQTPPLENEKRTLESQINGWSQSLAKPDLPANLRSHIEQQFEAALQRKAEIEQAVEQRAAESQLLRKVTSPADVAERLGRLAEVLAGNNPPLGNIELAHHIDKIDCYSDGKVVVRTCKLGALTGAIDLLREVDVEAKEVTRKVNRRSDAVVPRRLTRRRIDSGEAPTDEFKSRAIWATDPNRFSGLDERWFEDHVFEVPRRLSWVELHAPEVGARRKLGDTEEKLAKYFGKTLPTIREALKIARKSDPELLSLPRRMPRPRWHEQHALEIAAKKAAGMSTNELAAFYDKSDTTIRSALIHAKLLATQAEEPSRDEGIE